MSFSAIGRLLFASAFPAIAAGGVAAAADNSPPADPEGMHFFEAHVRPILSAHCYQCHSQKAEKLKAGLYLDSKAGVFKGSESGPIIVPGKADDSLLIKAVRYQVEDLEMPPKKKLPEFAIDHLAEWINRGAPMPDDGTTVAETRPAFDFGK
ncbi:MAG: hypothetical protein GWO24_26705, partial [Akkermansiaceae bacterium]|nr:hypothetical protein [Akkermansiaceae bacterium]